MSDPLKNWWSPEGRQWIFNRKDSDFDKDEVVKTKNGVKTLWPWQKKEEEYGRSDSES